MFGAIQFLFTMRVSLGLYAQRLYHVARQSSSRVTVVDSPSLEEVTQWNFRPEVMSNQVNEVTTSIFFNEITDHIMSLSVSEEIRFCPDSPIRFFTDGAQHTRLLFVVDTVPVYLTINAVGIMKRDHPGGELARWIIEPSVRGAFLIPKVVQTASLWDACRAEGIAVEDTFIDSYLKPRKLDRESAATDYELCRYLAYARSRELRQILEREAIHTWAQSDCKGWLMVDGDTRHLGSFNDGQVVIGVVKSHRYQYFQGLSHALLFNLPAFHRTNSFSFRYILDSERVRSSFYLRWRQRRNRDEPDYGLIRLEIPFDPSQLDFDQLSRWIIAENRPFQSGRNGNHLYPVARSERTAKHIVEDYERQLPRRWFNMPI